MIGTLAHTGRLANRRLRNLARQPWYLGVMLAEPFVWLLFFGGALRQIVTLPAFEGTPGSYLDFLLPGVVIMNALVSGAWAGSGMLLDIERGVLDRFLVTPARRGALVLGPLAQQIVLVTVQGAMVFAIGVALGARTHGGPASLGVLFACAALLAVGTGALSQALALVVRKHDTLVAVVNFVVLPATFLSSAFVPEDAVAPWMATVASYSPVNWATSTVRSALSAHAAWADVAVGTVKLAVFAATATALSALAFRAYRRGT